MNRLSGIKQQTLLIALIPIFLMALLLGSYSIYSRFADADRALLEYSKLTSHHIASTSEYAMFTGNIQLLKQGINYALLEPEINYVVVLDAASKPLIAEGRFASKYNSLPGKINLNNPSFEDSNVLILYEPITATQLNLDDTDSGSSIKNEKLLGAVVIEFSKNNLSQQKTTMLLINLLVMMIVIFIAIVAALWLARRISNPIISMGIIIHDIGNGLMNARIPPQSSVIELSELAIHINKMAQQLADDRKTLEQRIQHATKNLRDKKEESEQAHQEVLQLNDKLSFALNELESIIEANPDLLYVLNTEGKLIKWNSNLEKFSGLTHTQILNRSALEFFCEEDHTSVSTWIGKILITGSASVQARCIKHDGTLVHYLCNGVILKNPAGEIVGFTGTGRDITDRIEAAEQLQHMAHYDALTDLPNRALFSDRLQQALAEANRDKKRMALMFLDLDRFKHINDTLGHHVGDLLLKESAQRMLGCVRESDTVARIGGDEFIVLLHDIDKIEDVRLVAEKIQHSLSQPLNLAGNIIGISSSLGIAIYPDHGNSGEELINHADNVMYSSKEAARRFNH